MSQSKAKSTNAEAQARHFFDAIHPKGYGQLELRIIDPQTGRVKKEWPSDNRKAVRVALREGRKRNVYVGVAPRKDSRSSKKTNVAYYSGVWVDVDFSDFEGEETEAKERLDTFPIKPTLLIHSGGGFHVYFLLHQPIPVTEDAIPRLEQLNKNFAIGLGGDKCHSVEHILRIPSTMNLPNAKKVAAGRKPVLVQALVLDGPRYTIEEIEKLSTALEEAFSNRSTGVGENAEARVSLPARFLKLLEEDTEVRVIWEGKRTDFKDKSRSAYDIAMSNRLVKLNFSHAEIKQILSAMPSGRGSSATNQYQDITINKASTYHIDEKSSPTQIAYSFLQKSGLRTSEGLRLRYYRQGWLEFNGRCYQELPTHDLEGRITRFLQSCLHRPKITKYLISNVVYNIQGLGLIPSNYALPIRPSGNGWLESPNLVCVSNGIIDLRKIIANNYPLTKFRHTPNFITTMGLTFAFDPKATCPRWEAFLRKILPDQQMSQLMKEMFGYCLTYDTRYQVFFMLEGLGMNGKSVLLKVLTELLGEQNVSSLPLEKFSDSHGLETTLGKLVNIVTDVGEIDKVSEGMIKQFTGGDHMFFNPKFRQGFSAKPTAKLIFSTNTRPPFRDRSEGIWRRMLLAPFKIAITLEEQDENLPEELTQELSGIFNWAVDGYRSLLERRHFAEPEQCRKAKNEYRLETNPARAFLEEEYEAVPNAMVFRYSIYKAYELYCMNNGFNKVSAPNFGKEVMKLFPNVCKKRITRESGRREAIYKGIKYRK